MTDPDKRAHVSEVRKRASKVAVEKMYGPRCTPEESKAAIETLAKFGWTLRHIRQHFGVHRNTVGRWAKGDLGAPKALMDLAADPPAPPRLLRKPQQQKSPAGKPKQGTNR